VVTLLRAPNASAMTLQGTNSYLLDCGGGEALVIDPGPAIDAHLEALTATAAARALRIRTIVLTHGHPDHSAGAPRLAASTGANVLAHPNAKVPHDGELPLEGELRAGGVSLRVVDGPGHTFDHAIFYLESEGALFTGDTILGEGTAVVAPPGGAMRPYQRTLQRLAAEFGDARTIYPGHGPLVADPRAKIDEYIAHRQMRERQILDALRPAPQTIPELVRKIYAARRHVLWPAMARQILAHLVALESEGRVAARVLDRTMSDEENAILNPRIEEVVGPQDAAVIVAELGTELRLESLREYALLEGDA
jgi:glyoxylase-like metal-dependent hydrolase (beta-lactamase superfamily II)